MHLLGGGAGCGAGEKAGVGSAGGPLVVGGIETCGDGIGVGGGGADALFITTGVMGCVFTVTGLMCVDPTLIVVTAGCGCDVTITFPAITPGGGA